MMTNPMGGLGWNLGTLPFLSNAQTRSISAENYKGEKGKGGMATEGAMGFASKHIGPGWKVSPCVNLSAKELFTVAEIDGPGVIQHIWITTDHKNWRSLILRFYWDDEDTPSVEVPLGDFFCMGWNEPSTVVSIPVCVNPRGGMNSYWPMPFRKNARITVENISDQDAGMFFYQVTYALCDVPENVGYFHAQFRQMNPVPRKEVYTIVDGIKGQGQYVGTYVAWQANNQGWWGEGELKFFMDGDTDYPTICGTGTEDYFGGAWGFEDPAGTYVTYTTPFLGFHQHAQSDGHTKQGRRFGLYRWHVTDPIIFQEDMKITMQALGDGSGYYLPLCDTIASVGYWYQTEPHVTYPEIGGFHDLVVH